MDSEVQNDVRELREILRRLEAAENAGDAGYFFEMMADDAVIMVPDYPVQEGKAACAAFVRDTLAFQLEEFDRHITYVSAEVQVIGDMAFDRGTFSFTVCPRGGGQTTEERGKYLWIYSRARDRSWRIARAIVSLDERDDGHDHEQPRSTEIH
jgi:uncharacterized protein (TIGR02246 family)